MKRNIFIAAVLVCGIAAMLIAQDRTAVSAEAVSTTLTRVKRDITLSPPIAERAAIKLLRQPSDKGNAVLFVQFSTAERAPRSLTINLERGKATLHDDGVAPDVKAGDGTHSALITIDVDQFKRAQDPGLRAKEIPIFAGREKIAVARPQLSEVKIESFEKTPPLPSRVNALELARNKTLIERVSVAKLDVEKFIPIFPFLVNASDVDTGASLMITNPSVVNDPTRTFNPCTNTGNPNGQWTFNHLMSELAQDTGVAPNVFVRNWLKKWQVDQNVNDFAVQNRAAAMNAMISAWPKVGGKLDLTKSPMKLVAIVNRVDLRANTVYGGGSAGEARFVFAAMNASCVPQKFLIIFEYGVRKPSCPATKSWGKQWFDLKNNPVGSAAYNNALQAITDQFTEAGTNPAQTPNHSSLNQLRTNEIALASPWELREFRLSSSTGLLFEDTTKQSPDDSFNKTQTVADYMNANAALIVQDKHVVPDLFLGDSFLGGNPRVPFPPNTFFWDGPAPAPSAAVTGPPKPNLRHHLSLNTCNGCHGGETNTFFTHVSETGGLSGFLTGIAVNDPAGEGVVRNFNDLQRRQQSLAALVNQPCFILLLEDPLRMEH
ncbi:MAG: hypothetical protein ACTHQM_18410 [Thermoanaerobaculia bacterium]